MCNKCGKRAIPNSTRVVSAIPHVLHTILFVTVHGMCKFPLKCAYATGSLFPVQNAHVQPGFVFSRSMCACATGLSLDFVTAYATRREFFREILYKHIAIIAIQHSKMYFVDAFGDLSHTVELHISFNSPCRG